MQANEELVFDIGAHRGEDSDYYLRRGFRVIAVECDPEHVAFLRERFAHEIKSGQMTLIDRAIATQKDPIRFFRNKNVSVWGTANPDWAKRNEAHGTTNEEIMVETISPDQLFRDYGIPFYLKIDIEGSDMLVVGGLAQFEQRPMYLSLESEAVYFDRLRDEFTMLRKLGYDKFKLSPQHLISEQRIPDGSRHGRLIDHTFEYGSSGLFGEDLDGPWLEEREAIRNYRSIFVLYHLELALRSGLLQGSFEEFLATYGYEGVWYDTHARHSSHTE